MSKYLATLRTNGSRVSVPRTLESIPRNETVQSVACMLFRKPNPGQQVDDWLTWIQIRSEASPYLPHCPDTTVAGHIQNRPRTEEELAKLLNHHALRKISNVIDKYPNIIEDPIEAMHREIIEETGLQPDQTNLLQLVTNDIQVTRFVGEPETGKIKKLHYRNHVFVGWVPVVVEPQVQDPNEVESFGLVKFGEIPNIPGNPHLPEMYKIISTAMASDLVVAQFLAQ